MEKLLFNWRELKATFWFVPVVIIIFSILLSIGLVSVDGSLETPQDGLVRFFFVKSADSARSILSTISAAMMGVAGTVFSITLVALTLASSQFGPRLIKNFMYVRLNQVVLGAYISTYLYCLLVLNAVREGDDYSFIPSISILVAIVAAIVNILLLIVFIHKIAISIQADNVVSDIADFLSKQVKSLFPAKMGEEKDNCDNIDPAAVISRYKNQITIKSPKSGYFQYVDSEALMEVITKKDALFELYFRPGAHLVEGIKMGVLFTNSTWEEKEIEKISSQFVVGKAKTAQQDLEYSIDQMVEIAARALSPGVNDPYTAMSCIDNLTTCMCYLAQIDFPSNYRFDENDNLRLIVDTLDFEGVMDAAFNQIRQFSGGSPAVIIRLMEAMITIDGFATKERYKQALIKHAEMVLRVGKETMSEKNDLKDLKARSEQLL
ncbi:DUF2254 domain-containing protein [Lunatibacter salilacus]|uniref:DUF2254 domain-containing protein n=1 Tax=Lunatibacter salilacus TaxID=2483804 RepID=UPI00131BF0F1|nr:DUF2254 domain-containing protein [Lunatibacter salilacus]